MTLNCNGKILDLHTKKIMGIINLSQDSFYDGGKYDSIDKVNAQISNLISVGKPIGTQPETREKYFLVIFDSFGAYAFHHGRTSGV